MESIFSNNPSAYKSNISSRADIIFLHCGQINVPSINNTEMEKNVILQDQIGSHTVSFGVFILFTVLKTLGWKDD